MLTPVAGAAGSDDLASEVHARLMTHDRRKADAPGASYEPDALKFHTVRSSAPGWFGFCGKPFRLFRLFGKLFIQRVAEARLP